MRAVEYASKRRRNWRCSSPWSTGSCGRGTPAFTLALMAIGVERGSTANIDAFDAYLAGKWAKWAAGRDEWEELSEGRSSGPGWPATALVGLALGLTRNLLGTAYREPLTIGALRPSQPESVVSWEVRRQVCGSGVCNSKLPGSSPYRSQISTLRSSVRVYVFLYVCDMCAYLCQCVRVYLTVHEWGDLPKSRKACPRQASTASSKASGCLSCSPDARKALHLTKIVGSM
jgi:hypothetical protein